MSSLRVRYVLLVAAVFSAVALIRILGASDLHQNEDQTRTLSFTADMVLNHNYFLPRDVTGEISRKPPLVNWVGIVLPAMGLWGEWALKFPSLLGAVMAVMCCVFMARHMSGKLGMEVSTDAFAAAAGLVCIASASMVKHMYFLRPDMLHTAFLAGAWVFGTLAMEEHASRRVGKAAAFWVFVGLAALTKGPTAFIPVLYVVLSARFLHGRWARLNRTGWWWGLPLAALLFCVWLVPAWRLDAEYVRGTLVGYEVMDRIGTDPWHVWAVKCLKSSWKIPHWFVERFLPWSVPAVAALFVVRPRLWRTHPFAPAVLWVLTVLVFFLPVEHRGGSFFMPAEPAAASLAVLFLCAGSRRFRITPKTLAMVAVMVALAFVVPKAFFGDDARRGVGDEIKQFARAASQAIGNEPVVYVDVGLNPVSILMGRHPMGEPSRKQIEESVWMVKGCADGEINAVIEHRKPQLVSKRLERDIDKGQGRYLCLIKAGENGL